MDSLEKLYYGNTLTEWLYALLIILGTAVIGKLAYWLIGKFVKKLTAKTKTKLDDILVEKLEKPLIFAVVLGGIWYAIHTLLLPETLLNFIDRAYYILIVLNITWFITRLIDALIEEYVAPLIARSEGDLDDQLLPIVRKGIRFILWTMAIILALNNAGYDVGALLAGLGIGGLAFALAAQDTVSNLFGGFTIFTDKPFKLKERIKVNGYDGVVEEIGIRSTRIRTLEGRLVTIPNSDVANNSIENISSEPSRKVVLNLGLTYDMSDEQVVQSMEIVKQIAAENENVDGDGLTAFNAFNDFSLNVLFIYYILPGKDILETQTQMNLAILKRFNAAGLEFAFPTQTILKKEI